jgi:Fe-S-cluster containining protein
MGEPFYSKGLRFDCRRCSRCCGGGPGYVFLTKADLERLLGRLGLDFPSFFKKYCTTVDTGLGMALSLRETPDYDCILWGGKGCSVYEDRPVQCSTYPFWASVLESRRGWEEESASCPGIGEGGLRDRTFIEECLYARRAESTIVFEYGADPLKADPARGA